MSRKKTLKRVTIFDVAQAAGVSHATVSRVINQSAYVDPEKQRRVIQAMAQLGFSVNQHARSLAKNRSQLIGLLTIGMPVDVQQHDGTPLSATPLTYTADYDRYVLSGIQAELTAHQQNLILYWTTYQTMSPSAYASTLARGVADGFLLLLPDHAQVYVDALRQTGVPFVLIDHQLLDDPGPSVRSTNRQGAYEATRYLLQLGHRRIAFITGHVNWGCSLERLAGYKAALADCGMAFDPALMSEGNFTEKGGYQGAHALLNRADPPTAIFASNDESALGVMNAARERNLMIPDDLSIVGFDDDRCALNVKPHLTTVRQPADQIGRTAARFLLEYIENPELAPQIIELPTELIIRGTTQSPRPAHDRS